MPGFYPEDEYDLAGFSVGVVDKDKVLDRNSVKAGDVMIALPSSGVHSNGFSLVRKVFDVENADIKKSVDFLSGNPHYRMGDRNDVLRNLRSSGAHR